MLRPAHAAARRRLLVTIEASGVSDRKVLRAIERVPRERFVPDILRSQAYANVALPIAEGQTISQPEVVALMAQAASLQPGDHVLEVGCGSGYGAAVLAEIARDVVTVEIRPQLAIDAERRLANIGYTNVHVVVGDGSLGWPDLAPYDAIVVTAATPQILPSLLAQLNDRGGRLVAPVGTINRQVLQRAVREGTSIRVDILGEVRFVPLVGAAGFAGQDPSRRN